MSGDKKLSKGFDVEELNRLVALQTWDKHHEMCGENFKSIISFAQLAIRTSTITNAAALAAFLGFITQPFGAGVPVGYIALSFALGLFFATISAGTAYTSQIFFGIYYGKTKMNFKHPYIEESDAAKQAESKGMCFQISSIILIIMSYICTVVGGSLFYYYFKSSVYL